MIERHDPRSEVVAARQALFESAQQNGCGHLLCFEQLKREANRCDLREFNRKAQVTASSRCSKGIWGRFGAEGDALGTMLS
jgi:hypothetical protein